MKEYRVADIISPFKLILNCGLEAEIVKGDVFLIYSLTIPIKDPVTGEELEAAEIIKGRGKVIHSQKKICTIESIEQEKGRSKIIRKNQSIGLFMGATEETISDPNNLPFEDANIGDYARLITPNK